MSSASSIRSYGSSPDLKRATRQETRRIMERQMQKREKVKQQYLQERAAAQAIREQKKRNAAKKTAKKMSNSPFHIDLVAESERIDEENRVRLREQQRRQKVIQRRTEKAKTEIILKALSEPSDLDALRQEKRAIMMEEKRLKALLDLERASAHRKADLLAAQRAERHRKAAKGEFQRQQARDATFERQRLEREILMEKHGLGPTPDEVLAAQQAAAADAEEY